MAQEGPAIPAKAQPFAQLAIGTGIAALTQPVTVAKILVQIGHEPMAPVKMTSFFGKQYLAYPNIFKYMTHIRKTDGFLGMYRGFGARVVAGAVASTVTHHVSEYLETAMNIKDENKESPSVGSALVTLCKESVAETISRSVGTVVAHPFQVVMVRCIAQFVGHEAEYETFFGAVRTIYDHDGVLGFFKGLVPRLIGEIMSIWAVNLLVHVINNLFLQQVEGIPEKTMKGYTSAVCSLAVTNFTYPLTLTSNIMIVNQSGLAAGSAPRVSTYSNWIECLSELRSQGELKRGSSIFSRTYTSPATFRHDGRRITAQAF